MTQKKKKTSTPAPKDAIGAALKKTRKYVKHVVWHSQHNVPKNVISNSNRLKKRKG